MRKDRVMKKALIITGTVYMAMMVGAGAFMLFKPEAYGKYTAKFLTGFTNALEGIKEEI